MLKQFCSIAMLLFALAGCASNTAVATSPQTTVKDDTVGRADIGALLNNARAKAGLSPLAPNAQLTAAARIHAQDMARGGFFSHQGSDRSTPSRRVVDQGYDFCFVAENIAQGWQTPQQVMQGWMDSAGHRANNLSTKATEYGAARARGDYWVLVLARPGC
ncbi:CAP domain-containing protein [Litoreibacter arenae]|uniref:Allergen V5/Tpx-1 family protein n=1 Tax=Litoreibacter arenae DSM 19593 TaxID=1123360 RepID=S9QNB0_9RHOB|nr:CAP domain-containing protein [Litoreibacter arenae]EPX81182.1 Allergen V5/Tpx-1 family protein [Litoreibacter arenae DSM 19593]